MGDSANNPWIGWRGTAAHPDAPAGGGGPGAFSGAGSLGHTPPTVLVHPESPQARLVVDFSEYGGDGGTPTQTGAAPNPPPLTQTSSTVLAEQHTDLLEVKVTLEFVADGQDTNLPDGTAETHRHTGVDVSIPGTEFDSKNVVTKAKGKFTMVGPVTIQTNYGPDTHPADLSEYGRGTTEADVRNGDTTIGFHESCHRADYLAFFTSHPIPAFTGKIGMTQQQWNAAASQFQRAYARYFDDADSNSERLTDEVGNPTLSQLKAKRKKRK